MNRSVVIVNNELIVIKVCLVFRIPPLISCSTPGKSPDTNKWWSGESICLSGCVLYV